MNAQNVTVTADVTARRRASVMGALVVLVVLLALVSLGIGPVRLSPLTVIDALLGGGGDVQQVIVREIRLPRTILGLAIGAILGLSGAALQGLLCNPLASPSLFGAPQSAAFGAVLVIAFGRADVRSWALPVAAIIAAFASVFALLAVAGRNAGLLILILAGLAISSLAGAATALVMNLSSNPFVVLEIAFWLLGSLEDRSFRHVMLALPFIAAGAIILISQRNVFRALSLGEETAQSLGVDVGRLRLSVILGTALGVGGAVAVAGTIGFIGLVAPHLVRPLIGHDPARLLVPSALTGAALLLAADIAVRIIPSTSDIKVGVLTSIIGVPFFLSFISAERGSLGGGAGGRGCPLGGGVFAAAVLRERGRRFAYLPQGHIVHWPLPARDIVALGRYPHGAADPSRLTPRDSEAVSRAMQVADVVAFADRRVTELSG